MKKSEDEENEKEHVLIVKEEQQENEVEKGPWKCRATESEKNSNNHKQMEQEEVEREHSSHRGNEKRDNFHIYESERTEMHGEAGRQMLNIFFIFRYIFFRYFCETF